MSRKPAWLVILVPFLMGWEGVDLVARHQAIDPPGVITYCNGRTNADGGNVRIGQRFTKKECENFVVPDAIRYDKEMQRCYPMETLHPHRRAAMVDFAYNVGVGTFCKSSVRRYLKEGNVRAACNALLRFDRANGRVLRGLEHRRQAERVLCLRED